MEQPGETRLEVLVCAGLDPTGGAGVDADAEAVRDGGAAPRTVVTADTEQDGTRVFAVRGRDPDDWARAARTILESSPMVRAVKFGLLHDAPAVAAAAAVASIAREAGLPVVVDPVLAASGGERFLDGPGLARLLDTLIPVGVVLTPNLLEAAELTGQSPEGLVADPEARIDAARALIERGASAVVVKGGHGVEDPVRDLLLARGRAPAWTEHPRLPGPGLHGSGCRFASHLAAFLARGFDLPVAVAAASGYLAERIAGR